jgi:hypothetical protein
MTTKKLLTGAALLSLPLLIGGFALANAMKPADQQSQQALEKGYICPATGEELPCPHCCPLNK